jgi:S-adenosyl-L-methionine hydrolase (adenosine-forming)
VGVAILLILPVITLLTDFGLRDPFVGIMKGVIASIAPRARVVDVAHDLDAFQLNAARFALAQAWPYFPRKTIHVVVVDPGVGSARRPILVQAAGHLFIGPDNGVFSALLRLDKRRVRLLNNEKLFLRPLSRTFHGRDIFAPVAAHLASGLRPSQVGPLIQDALFNCADIPIRTGKRTWSGQVLAVDRFGNCATSFRLEDFPQLRERPFLLHIGLATLVNTVNCYADIPAGQAAVVQASHGYLEVAAQQQSAARLLGVACGSPVELEVL